ncbi:MAG: hypothetical protein ACUVRS_09140 [Armatimonadota bacterium]
MNTNLRPGMLINMRRRMWRVESAEGNILTATPIDDLGAPRQRFLTSIELPEHAKIEPPSLDSFGDSTLHTCSSEPSGWMPCTAQHRSSPYRE